MPFTILENLLLRKVTSKAKHCVACDLCDRRSQPHPTGKGRHQLDENVDRPQFFVHALILWNQKEEGMSEELQSDLILQ